MIRPLFLSLLASASLCGAADTNFFPIMAWNWAPNDPAVLNKMKEAGLTVAGFVAPSTLDACHAAGLKAIVSDPRTSNYDWAGKVDPIAASNNVFKLVQEVGQHPSVIGYYLRDEPPASFFGGLAVVADLVRQMAPGKWPYINLFPDYASNEQLAASGYADYVETFIAACKPPIVSYDNYSLMDDGSIRNNYWSNLESVSAAARKHEIDFWNIVLATAHFNYRELSHADFRFQVYTTLAYGGRGISYFTYFAPQVGNYRMAPVDQFGNVTPNWHFMQNVNLQVQKLAPTLLQLKWTGAYHFNPVPAGSKTAPADSMIAGVAGDNALVGEFMHRDGSRYVMIVNKDLHRSRPCAPSFRTPPGRLRQVSPYTGALTAFEGEYVWMAPGQGVLLKVE